MPFNAPSDFDSPEKYQKLFKTELSRLGGEPGEFYFAEGYPLGKEPSDVLLIGNIKSAAIKALKENGAKFAWGQVTPDKKKLQLQVMKGKVVPSKLKNLFSGTGFTFEIVDGIDEPDKPTHEDVALEQKTVKAKRALFSVSETFKDMGHVLASSVRSDLRKELDKAEKLIEQKKPDEAQSIIDKAAKDLDEEKAATKQEFATRKATLEKDLDTELKEIARQLGPLTQELEKEERNVKRIVDTIANMEEAQKKKGIKLKEFNERKQRIDALAPDLEEARKTLKEVQDRLTPQIETLKQLKDKAPSKMLVVVQNMQQRLKAVEASSKSAAQSHKELSALVGKMAQATVWQEDNVDKTVDKDGKKVVDDDYVMAQTGHGTGRHGAQTGLDRQAQRAATQGVTPDSAGNKHGVTQHEAKWNKVTIEYEENDKGEKVIKNKTSVEKQLIAAAESIVKSDIGSTWATPVLEREAVKKAIATAKALQAYTHYDKGGTWKEFKSLAITLGKPEKSVGWGYAVERAGNIVDPAVAKQLLTEFEKGEKTQDELFKDLNVKLLTKDGGVQMTRHAVVVFKRAVGGAAWELLTHYPNHELTAADVGWECERDWRPGKVKFKAATGGPTEVSNKTLA